MAEWSKAAVLKTAVPQGTGGSNPSSSAAVRPAHRDTDSTQAGYGRGDRVAEGIRLLSGRRSKAYRGFESHPLRCGAKAKGNAPDRHRISVPLVLYFL